MAGARAHSAKRICMTLIAVVAVLGLPACDWSQLAYGPEHAGYSPDVSLSKAAVQSGSVIPQWTAATGGPVVASPAVVGAVTYVTSKDGRLYAFDTAGTVGCPGTSPKTCSPLWTSGDLGGPVTGSPAVSGGLVFVATPGARLLAFDAAGATGCSGTPKTCTPVWSATLPGSATTAATVADGRVFVVSAAGAADALSVFRATDGAALWSATVVNSSGSGTHTKSAASVSGGVAYVGFSGVADAPPETPQARVLAFDATGANGCAGTPVTCAPLWETATGADLGTMGTPSITGRDRLRVRVRLRRGCSQRLLGDSEAVRTHVVDDRIR